MNNLPLSLAEFLFLIFSSSHGGTDCVFQVLPTFDFLDNSICFIIYYTETFLIDRVFLFALAA